MTTTALCTVAPGPHLGGFPILAEFTPIRAERDLGDEQDGVEITRLLTSDGIPVGRWFTKLLSDDQWLDLHEQCASSTN